MEGFESEHPAVYVTQSERPAEETDYYYRSADFVMVHGPELHIWADGVHFTEDPDGTAEEGQYYVKHTDAFLAISKIENIKEEKATVRRLFMWLKGDEVSTGNALEETEVDIITGDYNRPMGDTATTTFIQPVE